MRPIQTNRLKARFLVSFEKNSLDMFDLVEMNQVDDRSLMFKKPIALQKYSEVRSLNIVFELGNKQSNYEFTSPEPVIDEQNFVIGLELNFQGHEKDRFTRDLTLARC